MEVFFIIAFIVLLLVRLLFGYFVGAVPVFEVLLPALTWLTVAAGILAGVFIAIKIYKDVTGKR